MIRILDCTSNLIDNFGRWSKMTLKSFSYFLPKLQNQLTKNGHNFSKKCFKNWSFQKEYFNEEIQCSGTFFVIDIIWKLQFLKHLKHFLLKLYPFFVTWFWSFVQRHEFDFLRVIFDQWPKLHLGLDVRPEIPILKGYLYTSSSTFSC